MRRQNPLILFVACLMCMTSCGKQEQSKRITISGAFALYPLVTSWAEQYQREHPGIRLDIQAGGAGKGMVDVLSNTADLGMFSREITDAEKEKGVWWMPVAVDAVVPTIGSRNPAEPALRARGFTQAEFAHVFLSKGPHRWREFDGIDVDGEINIYTRSDACGAAATWAAYLGGLQEQLAGVGVFGDPGLADAVARDARGIGFNNTVYVYDITTGNFRENLAVIPIDQNGNGRIDPAEDVYADFPTILAAIAEGRYPSPPARKLYLIANGTPGEPAVTDFLHWVLTTGQASVAKAGYVPLAESDLREALQSLSGTQGSQ